MGTKSYKQGCKGCDRSLERDGAVGGIVRLDGKWILNHYQQKDQGFLGWLALQPELHTENWGDLEDEELQALGPNIKQVKQALREYWKEHFPKDKVKRIYVVYLFDWDELPSQFHLHIHLIPRFDKLAPLLKEKGVQDINAWNIYRLTSRKNDFPKEYRWSKPRIEELMKELRSFL